MRRDGVVGNPGDVGISVVIPAYNSAPWLKRTIEALVVAAARTTFRICVVVVDDGSTDETESVLSELAPTLPFPLEVITQSNEGRFSARWAGLQRAQEELVLLLDSRVLIGPDSLRHLHGELLDPRTQSCWNGHMVTDPEGKLVGQFWDVPTHLFWSAYLRAPRPMTITPANFDRVPKGTGMFLGPKDALVQAFRDAWPIGDSTLVSDDTKVLRSLVENCEIRLDPRFEGVYRPRTSVRSFVSHSFDRGTLFVDSYGGTSLLRSVIILGFVISPFLLASFVMYEIYANPASVWVIATVGIVALLAAVFSARWAKAAWRSILAFVFYMPIFVFPFWAGVTRGVFVHRSQFRRKAATSENSGAS